LPQYYSIVTRLTERLYINSGPYLGTQQAGKIELNNPSGQASMGVSGGATGGLKPLISAGFRWFATDHGWDWTR